VAAEEGDRPIYLTEHFARLYNNDKFADCYFIVGEGKTQKRFPAHKLILSASSPLFEAMLYRDPAFGETPEDSEAIEVKLTKCDPIAFDALLQCVYTDKVEVDSTNISQLIQVATKYQVEKLRVACADFMEMDVNIENVCSLFEIAPKLLGDQEFGLKFIEENTEEVIKSETFLKLSKDRMLVLLQDDKLTAEEGALFDAILKWADYQVERKVASDNKEILKDLIKYIRFPLMEVTKIASVVSNCGLLDQDQLLSVFQYVAVSDEKKKSDMKVPFNTKPRLGKKTIVVEWDGAQSFTNGLYTITNKGRTARKSGSEGTIYILRAKEILPTTGIGKYYWEVHIEALVVSGTADIQLGAAIGSFSWTSAWLKSTGSYYLEGQHGGGYLGSGTRVFDCQPFQTNDRFGFLVDYKKQTIEVTRGKGKTGKMSKVGTFTGITQAVYPVMACRPVGNTFTTM